MQDIAIVGGGSSGLMSAITIKRKKPSTNVIILEKLERIGKKILATGNGRCNFSNMYAGVFNYHGHNNQFVIPSFDSFSVSDTLDFFYELGILHKEGQNGKIYPYSDQASSIVDALRNEVERLKIPIEYNFEVDKIIKDKIGFKITSKEKEIIKSKKLVLSVGGQASPNLGTNGDGYRILKSFGHTISYLTPALVQLKTKEEFVKGLKGIKFIGEVKCFNNDKMIACEHGEVLFTDYGVSGPPIFQISKLYHFNKNMVLKLDFMPSYNFKEVYEILEKRKNILAHLNMENYFNGLLNKRIGNVIAKNSGVEKLSLMISDLTKDNLWKMASLIKELKLNVIGTNGFNNCQVTAGGAFTNEFCENTLQSKIVENLYCCGEILDIHGDCGGFNLQWAWSSGYLCGKSIVMDLS